jgi:hypothetical protein
MIRVAVHLGITAMPVVFIFVTPTLIVTPKNNAGVEPLLDFQEMDQRAISTHVRQDTTVVQVMRIVW